MTGKITLPLEVLGALRAGNKIEAIKLMREKTGIGLAEASALVDAYNRLQGGSGTAKTTITKRVGMQHVPGAARGPGLSPGEEPRSSAPWQVIAAIAVAIVAGLLWFNLR
jgi:hypothetical protein